MTRADIERAPTRRNILAGLAGGGLLAALPAQTEPHPDAELLALCAEYHRQFALISETDPHDDEAHFELLDDRWAVAEEIEEIKPATDEGLKAKAAIAMAIFEECIDVDGDMVNAHERFAYRILGDLVGRA